MKSEPQSFIDLENVFLIKIYTNSEESSLYKYSIILSKGQTVITLGTNEEKLFNRLFQHLRKLCIHEDFSKDYELKQHLGTGSFADVFMAINKLNGKRFAAKIIKKTKKILENYKVLYVIYFRNFTFFFLGLHFKRNQNSHVFTPKRPHKSTL